ncbi:MAG: RagB/SusD family nutrient uptake outer membrane protein [Bacteroidales bacterium]|nr:RagB/SusD family nutrient uptake outer membrane protein [Bacteroidales bacterium]
MRQYKIYFILLILLIQFSSCESLLEPENENLTTEKRLTQDPAFGEGLLMTAYIKLPTNTLSFNDVATDDAVSNDKTNSYLRMATGQWSALYNPVSEWTRCNAAIMYLNKFLTIVDSVQWKWSSDTKNKLYARIYKGEAYALKGVFEYYLLQATAGKGKNGELLGIPIYNNFVETDGNFNVSRATFQVSVDQIYADFDEALTYLTMDDYGDISSLSQLPAGFEYVTQISDYNEVFGAKTIHRISGKIIKAFKARVALLAASPAFSVDNTALWAIAADDAAVVLDKIGGIAGLDPSGHIFYTNKKIDAIKLKPTGTTQLDQKEIVWRKAISIYYSRESANFPPSLYGNGRVNPTQNLVDAFPMANGYPITDNTNSNYDPTNPYANRDPRLALYIVYNNSTLKNTIIKTGVGGGINAKDSISTSTRTGYYLRKLMRDDVNLDPISPAGKNHYETHMRYTELFLIYAEAANEAWGPDGKGTHAYSARDVIGAIRKRAGITQPDAYLASITTEADMEKLIRNERRLELCFEGFRFWDLRRWNADLTETAKGIDINNANMNIVNVELRAYDNLYMHYGPVPETEIVKFDQLIQNEGW